MLVTTKTRTSLLAIPFIKLSCDAQHSSLPVDPRFAARANQCLFFARPTQLASAVFAPFERFI